jgi:hypothetical protein
MFFYIRFKKLGPFVQFWNFGTEELFVTNKGDFPGNL